MWTLCRKESCEEDICNYICTRGYQHIPGLRGGQYEGFPPAEKGIVRYVLQFLERETASAYKVELLIGKTVRVDANRYLFGGQIKKETIKGWGFTRYTVSKLSSMAGSLMAVDPNMPKTDRFITLGGKPYLIRYKSLLPVVVYVPEKVEVRYRIWSAGDEQTINQG